MIFGVSLVGVKMFDFLGECWMLMVDLLEM
jgi:hypothetical protein